VIDLANRARGDKARGCLGCAPLLQCRLHGARRLGDGEAYGLPERPGGTGGGEGWGEGGGGGEKGKKRERERERERARKAEGEGAGENSRRAQQRTRSLQGAAAGRENVCCCRGQPALLGWALDSARSLGPGPARLVISAQSRGAAGCAPFGPGQIQMRWVWWTGGVRARKEIAPSHAA
jgi:hypothetical protein